MSNTSDTKASEWKNREVGALWKKPSANGKGSYCTGYIVSDELGNKVKHRVIMFSNKNKNNEKSPDFIIYMSNEQDGAPTGNTTPVTKQKTIAPNKATKTQAAPSYEDDDGIPM